MTETQCYMNFHPDLNQGLACYMIFRSAKTSRETILINREGQIECFTYDISQQLSLFSLKDKSSFEDKFIGKICPELQFANDAFNLIENNDAKGKSKLNLGEAKMICSNYLEGATTGQVVQLEKITNNPNAFFTSSEKFSYRCTINPLKNNTFGAKEIYLENIIERGTFEEQLETLDEIGGDLGGDSDNDPVIHNNNEKEAGWIDSERLQTNSGIIFETRNKPIPPHLRNAVEIASPTTTRGLVTSRSSKFNTQRALVTAKTESPELVGLENKLPDHESSSNVLSQNESIFSLKSEFLGRNKMKSKGYLNKLSRLLIFLREKDSCFC